MRDAALRGMGLLHVVAWCLAKTSSRSADMAGRRIGCGATVFACVAADCFVRKASEFDASASQPLIARPLRAGLVGLVPRAAVRRGHSATIPRATAGIDATEIWLRSAGRVAVRGDAPGVAMRSLSLARVVNDRLRQDRPRVDLSPWTG